jgi:hypothetical protein
MFCETAELRRDRCNCFRRAAKSMGFERQALQPPSRMRCRSFAIACAPSSIRLVTSPPGDCVSLPESDEWVKTFRGMKVRYSYQLLATGFSASAEIVEASGLYPHPYRLSGLHQRGTDRGGIYRRTGKRETLASFPPPVRHMTNSQPLINAL